MPARSLESNSTRPSTPWTPSTIDLCLSLFPWARFRKKKGGIKLHTLLDLRGNIPTFLHISDGKLHDVNVLDLLLPEAGALLHQVHPGFVWVTGPDIGSDRRNGNTRRS